MWPGWQFQIFFYLFVVNCLCEMMPLVSFMNILWDDALAPPRVTLPGSLRSLTSGEVFNQSMEGVILPGIGCLIGFTTLGKIRMKHYHNGNSCPQGRTLTSLWRHHTCRPVFGRCVVKACRCRLWQKAVSEKMRSWPGQMLYPQRCHQTWMAGKIMKFLDDFQGFSDSNMLNC